MPQESTKYGPDWQLLATDWSKLLRLKSWTRRGGGSTIKPGGFPAAATSTLLRYGDPRAVDSTPDHPGLRETDEGDGLGVHGSVSGDRPAAGVPGS